MAIVDCISDDNPDTATALLHDNHGRSHSCGITLPNEPDFLDCLDQLGGPLPLPLGVNAEDRLHLPRVERAADRGPVSGVSIIG